MNNARTGQRRLFGSVIRRIIVNDYNILYVISGDGPNYITDGLGFVEGWDDHGYFHCYFAPGCGRTPLTFTRDA